MTGRHAWAAAAVAAVWVAWWQATLAAPHWPPLPTGIGVLLAVAGAAGAVGAGTVREEDRVFHRGTGEGWTAGGDV